MRWLLAVLLLTCSAKLAVPPAPPVAKVTTDKECLAWVIYDEARGEPLRGQRAVLDVVLTRMKQRKQTACEVVEEPAQFSGYHQGVFKKISQEMLTTYDVVSKMSPVAANAEYFHATYVAPAWKTSMKRIKQVGNHIFYKARKGSPKESTHASK